MADRQVILPYHLPELISSKDLEGDVPLTTAKLEKWLRDLPVFNIEQLSYQLPKYIQQLNQANISDKQRFGILEQLRPSVHHLYATLTKQFCGRTLDLSQKSQEVQWLAGELIAGMAVGYQRLLSNIAKKKIGIMNRSQYTLLTQRTMYYLCEQVRLAYMINKAPKKGVWNAVNTTYSFACNLELNANLVTDQVAFSDEKGSIDSVYKQILLLAMVSPYSLRGAELEQVRSALWPWVDSIQLLENSALLDLHFAVADYEDNGPIYYPQIQKAKGKLVIDNTQLVEKLKGWQDNGEAPESVHQKGMTDKLLEQTIINLEAGSRRDESRIEDDNIPVEIVMGLQKIDLFLDYIDSLVQENESVKPIPKVEALALEEETDWNTLYFHAPEVEITSVRDITIPTMTTRQEDVEASVRRHDFTVENESKDGVCISCDSQNGSGLFIGELMFMRGFDPEVWTLGVVRWMKVVETKLMVGLYLISAHVDSVEVSKQADSGEMYINALWIAETGDGDSLLLPRSQFHTKDKLQLTHNGEELFVTLGKEIWHSEGFTQFAFTRETLFQNQLNSDQEYLISA